MSTITNIKPTMGEYKQYQKELVERAFSNKVSGTMVVELMTEAIRVDKIMEELLN